MPTATMTAATLRRIREVPSIRQSLLQDRLDAALRLTSLRAALRRAENDLASIDGEIEYRTNAGQATERGPLYAELSKRQGNPSYKTWIETALGQDGVARAEAEAPRSESTVVKVLTRIEGVS